MLDCVLGRDIGTVYSQEEIKRLMCVLPLLLQRLAGLVTTGGSQGLFFASHMVPLLESQPGNPNIATTVPSRTSSHNVAWQQMDCPSLAVDTFCTAF